REVLHARRAHHELALTDLEAQEDEVAEILDAREVEVREIAPVVDDALRVRVREADARERRELERRLAISGAPELDHSGDANPGTGCPPVMYWVHAQAVRARPGRDGRGSGRRAGKD